MFAPMCRQAHIIRVANIIRRSRHHLPKANIIQKTHLCRSTKVRFLLAEMERGRFELYSRRGASPRASLVLSHNARLRRAAAGATLLASLESVLSDSASRRYLRLGAEFKISASQHKNKKDTRKWVSFLLAEMERFELSRRYSRPTPLAGAPLHHLSTSPKMQGRFINLLDYYIKSARECQYLFIKKIKKEEDIGADPKYFAVLSLIFRN